MDIVRRITGYCTEGYGIRFESFYDSLKPIEFKQNCAKNIQKHSLYQVFMRPRIKDEYFTRRIEVTDSQSLGIKFLGTRISSILTLKMGEIIQT
jgi:hypothetical protein